MILDTYLDAATRRPWLYGGGPDGWRGHDCLLFIANWSHALLGTDPADDLRGTYSTQGEAEALLEKAGGYFGMMAERLRSAGWASIAAPPQTGDIGILSITFPRVGRIERPAIRRDEMWIMPWGPGRGRGLLPFDRNSSDYIALWRAECF